jgi:hypothetical protein
MLRFIGDVLLSILFLQTVEWMIAYHRLTKGKWRESALGRHLMQFTGAFALVLFLIVLRLILRDIFNIGDTEVFRIFRTAVFIVIPVVFLRHRIMLNKAQKQGFNDKGEG